MQKSPIKGRLNAADFGRIQPRASLFSRALFWSRLHQKVSAATSSAALQPRTEMSDDLNKTKKKRQKN
jgi:hypothetical protein